MVLVLILILLAQVAVSVGEVVQRAGGPGPLVLALAAVVGGVEALISRHAIHRRGLSGTGLARYRLAEALVLAVLARVAALAVDGLTAFGSEPLIDGQTLVLGAFLAAGWWAMHESAADLGRLGEITPDLAVSVQESLARRIMWGGVVLGTAAVLARLSFQELWDVGRPVLVGPVVWGLAYLVLGLWTVALIRRESAFRSWRLRGIQVRGRVGARWALAGFLAAVMMGILVLGLPVGITDELAFLAGSAAAGAGRIILTVLRSGDVQSPPPQGEVGVAPTNSVPEPDLVVPDLSLPAPGFPEFGLPPWVWTAYQLLFWLVIAGLIGYLLVTYLRARRLPRIERAGSVGRGILLSVLEVLARLWWWIRSALSSPAGESASQVRSRAGRSAGRSGVSSWLSSRTTSDRIIRLYLRMLAEGDRRGLVRRRSDTPSEYRRFLEGRLTHGVGEVGALTEVFLEARYSGHPLGAGDLADARRAWSEVRQGMRGRR